MLHLFTSCCSTHGYSKISKFPNISIFDIYNKSSAIVPGLLTCLLSFKRY